MDTCLRRQVLGCRISTVIAIFLFCKLKFIVYLFIHIYCLFIYSFIFIVYLFIHIYCLFIIPGENTIQFQS